MLKKLTLIIAAVTACASLYAQGTINFNNQVLGVRIYDTVLDAANGTNGALALNAAGAQLYSGVGTITDDSQLHAIGTRVNFHGGGNVGYVSTSGKNKWGETINPALIVPGTVDAAGLRVATVEMRAWDAAFDTYESALAGGGKTGKSNLIQVGVAFPPNPPPNLDGLKSFAISVPEPSTVALGVIGIGALLALRRRK